MFYDMVKEIPSENQIENIYSLCGTDDNGKILALVTYYTDDDNAKSKAVKIDFGRKGNYDIYLLDETHDGEYIKTTDCTEFVLERCNVVLIKEK
jgi:hypothetical protein